MPSCVAHALNMATQSRQLAGLGPEARENVDGSHVDWCDELGCQETTVPLIIGGGTLGGRKAVTETAKDDAQSDTKETNVTVLCRRGFCEGIVTLA